MIVLKRLSVLILLLLLLLLAVLAYATMTHGGMKRLFSLGQSYAQGELSWGESTGRLLGPATLDDVLYVSDTGASVKIDKARFDWMPGKLLSRTLQIDEIDLNGLSVRLPPPSKTPDNKSEPFELRDLALPFGAEIKKVNVENIKLYPHGAQEPIIIDSVKLSAGGRDDALKLVELSVAAPQGEFTMNGSVNTSGDWPVDLRQVWRVEHPQFGQFSGSGTMLGDTKALRVQHTVNGAAEVVIDTMINYVTAELSWDGSVGVQSDDPGIFSEALKELPLSVDAVTSGSLQDYQARGVLKSAYPLTGPLHTDFAVKGSLDEIILDKVTVNLDQSTAVAVVSGQLQFADLHSDLTVKWSDVPWPLISQQNVAATADGSTANSQSVQAPLVISPSGTLTFTGKPDDFDVKIESNIEQDAAGALGIALHIDGDPQIININSLAINSLEGETQLDAKGVVDLKQSIVDINGQWADLAWPLADQSEDSVKLFDSESGQFSIKGPLDEYKLLAELSVDGKDLPAGLWQLDANGNTESLSDINLTGQTLDGQITATGNALWSPSPQWTLDLLADGINPAVQWPGVEGNVGAVMRSVGSVGDNGPNVKLTIVEVSGDYQKQPLNGTGEITVADGVVTIDQLKLKAGIASVDANGTLGEALALEWKLNAPALDKILPGIQGDIDLKGKIAGSAQQPSSDFTIDIKNYDAGTIQVKSISGGGSIDLSGKAQSTVKLDINDINAAGQLWDRMELTGSGSPDKHNIGVTLTGDHADLAAGINGAVNGEMWEGSIDQIDILKTIAGDWKLGKPVAIKANAEAVEAGQLCLVSDPSSLCVDSQWSAASGALAEIELKDLNGTRFGDFLPPDLELDANLSGTATVKIDADGKPDVVADFIIPGGNINYLDTGEPVSDKLGESRIQFELRNDNVASKIDLDLGPIGTANVDAKIGGLSTTKNLSGTVKTDIEDMSVVSMFAPDLQALDGKFDTDMTLGGTLDDPQVVGETGLNGLVTEVPAIAMKVLDGTMKAESDGKGGLIITGTATSGDGKLDINGSVNPSTGDMDLTIKGEQFEVANTARQRAVINPDLKIKISGENISVTGDLHIPSAYIQAGGEDALVKESGDIVIVNSDDDAGNDKPESQVTLDVKVTLGDDIRVKAGQFNGALAGGITVQQQPGRVPTGSGTIEVVSGDFLVYGQKLTMERGRVLFGGGPIDNPALELDVARDVVAYEVKAGARIRGTAQAPLLQLQSDPTQTDANTLSYILFGRPVDNVGVSYTLGKFITPDLYVSYAIDLFDKLRTFNLRYRINEKLALIGASNSETSGADFIYTIER